MHTQQSHHIWHAVYFLKRAQILVAEIWACFRGLGDGRFDDIDELTMFADYRCGLRNMNAMLGDVTMAGCRKFWSTWACCSIAQRCGKACLPVCEPFQGCFSDGVTV